MTKDILITAVLIGSLIFSLQHPNSQKNNFNRLAEILVAGYVGSLTPKDSKSKE